MTQEQITDIKIGSNSAIKAMLNNKIVWPYVEKINTEDYMTIEILEDDSHILLRNNSYTDLKQNKYESVFDGYLYCKNGDGIWKELHDYDSNIFSDMYVGAGIFRAGDKVSFKKTMSPATKEIVPYFRVIKKIHSAGSNFEDVTFNLSGNCMSVIYGDDAKNHNSLLEYPYVFYEMFFSSNVINVSPNFLPATTLAEGCYKEMFSSCYLLTEAPKLPATTLTNYCYSYMFSVCRSLTEAPELPATTLKPYCYEAMFEGNHNLSKSPVLPATTLVEGCYKQMFDFCNNLIEITALFDSYNISATTGWVDGVGLGGTFIMNRNANWKPKDHRGPDGVPKYWSVVYY